jgi:hypothetical protein
MYTTTDYILPLSRIPYITLKLLFSFTNGANHCLPTPCTTSTTPKYRTKHANILVHMYTTTDYILPLSRIPYITLKLLFSFTNGANHCLPTPCTTRTTPKYRTKHANILVHMYTTTDYILPLSRIPYITHMASTSLILPFFACFKAISPRRYHVMEWCIIVKHV